MNSPDQTQTNPTDVGQPSLASTNSTTASTTLYGKSFFDAELQSLPSQLAAEKSLWNGPTLALHQPGLPSGDTLDLSYFRLGSYVATGGSRTSETKLVTNLSTTFGYLNETSSNSSATAQGGGTDAALVAVLGNVQRPSQSNGILLYSGHDLQQNVMGAGLMKYGKGHVVHVIDYDAAYTVKNGKYDLAANNGVFITAGSPGRPANFELVAQGYIKQTSYGEYTKKIIGPTNEAYHDEVTKEYFGNKKSVVSGRNLDLTLGSRNNIAVGFLSDIIVGASLTMKLAASTELSISRNIGCYLFGMQTLTLGWRKDIVRGKYTIITRGELQIDAALQANITSKWGLKLDAPCIERQSTHDRADTHTKTVNARINTEVTKGMKTMQTEKYTKIIEHYNVNRLGNFYSTKNSSFENVAGTAAYRALTVIYG